MAGPARIALRANAATVAFGEACVRSASVRGPHALAFLCRPTRSNQWVAKSTVSHQRHQAKHKLWNFAETPYPTRGAAAAQRSAALLGCHTPRRAARQPRVFDTHFRRISHLCFWLSVFFLMGCSAAAARCRAVIAAARDRTSRAVCHLSFSRTVFSTLI